MISRESLNSKQRIILVINESAKSIMLIFIACLNFMAKFGWVHFTRNTRTCTCEIRYNSELMQCNVLMCVGVMNFLPGELNPSFQFILYAIARSAEIFLKKSKLQNVHTALHEKIMMIYSFLPAVYIL